METAHSPALSTDVLIVGAGPVGCALAIELGLFGIASRVVDETDGSFTFPRYNQFSWRSTEYLRRWKIADELRYRGFPANRPLTCTYTTGLDGFEITRFEHPSNAQSKSAQDFSPESILWSPNFYSEPVLRRRTIATDDTDIAFRTRFVTAEEQGQHLIATVEDMASGDLQTIECRYVVGCDGGRSAIRKAAGLTLEGRFATDHQLAIHFRASIPEYWDRGLGVHTWILKPEVRALLVSVNGDDEWRCGPLGLTRDQVEERTPLEWLRLILGHDLDIDVRRASPWGGHYAVANHYRAGRYLIAGDAAHLLWPAGGFGMNTGLADAVNLAWKVAAVLQGWGGPDLLDSYEAERRPEAVQRVHESSDTRSADSFQVSPTLGSDTPQGAIVRAKAAAGIRASTRGRQWLTNLPGIDLGHVYEQSAICVRDGSPAAPWQPDHYEPSGRPGSRAPHVPLPDGSSTLDLFGKRFVLLDNRREGSPFPYPPLAVRIPWTHIRIPDVDLQPAYGAPLALVRPDGYIAWRSEQLPSAAELASILDRCAGWPS